MRVRRRLLRWNESRWSWPESLWRGASDPSEQDDREGINGQQIRAASTVRAWSLGSDDSSRRRLPAPARLEPDQEALAPCRWAILAPSRSPLAA